MMNVSTIPSSAMYGMNIYFIQLVFHFSSIEFVKM